MNRGTKTAGHVMADAGYQTAHYGKWWGLGACPP